ncbi:MAG TPA: hypothetical protein VGR69_02275 [Candidatus Rubrimentiphilum sp.]|nr:hypothetical protein [Candidatus Rubrimentiphilum sp.]
MKRSIPLALLLSAALLANAAAAAETWPVDPNHSSAQFIARHFNIAPVVGPGSEIPVEVSGTLDPREASR